MRSKFKVMFLATLLGGFMAIGHGQPAEAQLAAGTVNPVTGLPSSYGDANGVSLGMCEDGIVAGTPCIGALVNPALGFVQGNIEEGFYYDASAAIDVVGGGFNPVTNVIDGTEDLRLVSICAIEGISDGLVDNVLNRGRVDLRGLQPSTSYTFTTPCLGTRTELSDAGGRLFFTIDGIGSLDTVPPFAGNAFVTGPVQTFASNGTGTGVFLGNGVTAAPLLGDLRPAAGRSFQVIGPGVNQSTLDFTVVGKIFKLAPVAASPPPVTWTMNKTTGLATLNFKFTAPPFSSTAQVVGVTNGVPTPLPKVVEPFQLTQAGGRFTGSILDLTAADIAALPTHVAITFNLGIAGETPPPGIIGETAQLLPVIEKKGGIAGIPLLLEDE